MIVDTDVLIWFTRGNRKALRAIDKLPVIYISTLTVMELIAGARDRSDMRGLKATLAGAGCVELPVSENISHRAVVYLEEYRLRSALDIADALIAATAVEHQLPLLTANRKHYKLIEELEIVPFKP